MKTKKLNLNDLKVDSFVTSLADKKEGTVKGGAIISNVSPLATAPQFCGCSPWLSLGTGPDCAKLTVPYTSKV